MVVVLQRQHWISFDQNVPHDTRPTQKHQKKKKKRKKKLFRHPVSKTARAKKTHRFSPLVRNYYLKDIFHLNPSPFPATYHSLQTLFHPTIRQKRTTTL